MLFLFLTLNLFIFFWRRVAITKIFSLAWLSFEKESVCQFHNWAIKNICQFVTFIYDSWNALLTEAVGRLEVFCKQGVRKNFAKLTGNTCARVSFFNKVAGLRLVTLLKETLAQVFSCQFCETFKSTSFYRTPPVAASVLITFMGISRNQNL